MTSTVKSWMFFSFSAMVFVIALSTAISLYSTLSSTLDRVSESNTVLDRNVHTTLGVPQNPVITGQEVALSVVQIPETKIDIVVNNHLFPRTLQFDQIDISSIPSNRSYNVNYERDSFGKLTKVIYTAQ